MRAVATVFLGAISLTVCFDAARAQSYYAPPDDPCRPVPVSPLGALFSGSTIQQRQAACLNERKAQWDEYNARQSQLQAQKAADDARQAEAQAAFDVKQRLIAIEQAAEEKRQARLEIHRRRLAYETQVAAETSLDNHCRVADVARALIEEWNDFDRAKEFNVKIIDIEHLTTTEFDPQAGRLVCHGVFVTNNGARLIGTLSEKKNVAGDPIYSWQADASQNLTQYDAPPEDVVEPDPAPAAPTHSTEISERTTIPDAPLSSSAFADGLTDRKEWEAWLVSLAGPEKDGAVWWASNRNSPHHQTCTTAPSKDDAAWEAGCMNAQLKLTPVDLKRRSNPQYKSGWNSL